MKHLIAIFIGLFSVNFASAEIPITAADIVGNGGDVVSCPQSVELLDLYEGRTLRRLQFDERLLGKDERVTVNKILERLQKFDPDRAIRYRQWAEAFWQEVAFVDDADLVDVPDSGHVAVPTGCKIEQVAIQIEPRFSEDPRYIVSKKLWERMGTRDRASLILHEVIYREAISRGQKNSIASRYFNSLLSSDVFSSFSDREYLMAILKVKFSMGVIKVSGFQWKGKDVFVQTEYNSNWTCSGVHSDYLQLSDSDQMSSIVPHLISRGLSESGLTFKFRRWDPRYGYEVSVWLTMRQNDWITSSVEPIDGKFMHLCVK